MTGAHSRPKHHIEYHRDGSIQAQGSMIDGKMDGYWEWFRKDGTKMRSGNFDYGTRIGEWITYDDKGESYKVTQIQKKSEDFASLSAPAIRALESVDVVSLSDLSQFSEEEIKHLHGIGQNALAHIKQLMRNNKISFK